MTTPKEVEFGYTSNGKWVSDAHSNYASIARWGSEAAAIASLKSLDNCFGCSDCSRCSRCSDCSRCFDASDCSGCFDCSRCSDCSRCFDASDCFGCSGTKGEIPDIPSIPGIHRAVYEAVSQPGALDMSTWHSECGTTHCRAGWVVSLAGEAGKTLEEATSTEFAAMQIYAASGHRISPCRFYDSFDVAMAEMKRLAEMEDTQ